MRSPLPSVEREGIGSNMPRRSMNPPPRFTFAQVYSAILNQPDGEIVELHTSGGKEFSAQAAMRRDGRHFIQLPHSNRIYEDDWGYNTNSMGKDGQRIGQYARPLDEWCEQTPQ